MFRSKRDKKNHGCATRIFFFLNCNFMSYHNSKAVQQSARTYDTESSTTTLRHGESKAPMARRRRLSSFTTAVHCLTSIPPRVTSAKTIRLVIPTAPHVENFNCCLLFNNLVLSHALSSRSLHMSYGRQTSRRTAKISTPFTLLERAWGPRAHRDVIIFDMRHTRENSPAQKTLRRLSPHNKDTCPLCPHFFLLLINLLTGVRTLPKK